MNFGAIKKVLIIPAILLSALSIYAQGTPRLVTLGILPFTATGSGVSEADAAAATRMVVNELSSWGTITILTGAEANNGEYLVKGQITRTYSGQTSQIVLSATTSEARSAKALNSSREQAPSLDAISILSFCTKIAENVPFPNYLLGKWRSTINMVDGPVTCIMEFRSNRTIQVQQFDTWEHDGSYILKYQGLGTGTYSYAGYLRRTLTIDRREVQTDATVGINLKLEDSLPKYKTVSAGGLRVLFDDSKNNFEFVYGGIPCGNNLTGASVYPSANVYYTKFTKIQ